MTSKQNSLKITWQKLCAKLIDAINTWKIYVGAVKIAQLRGNKTAKSDFMKAMFFWRKKAEELAQLEKSLRLELKAV